MSSGDKNNGMITLTFRDFEENHVGMEKIGKKAPRSLYVKDLLTTKKLFEDKNVKCEYIDLNASIKGVKELKNKSRKKAGVLVIRKGVKTILGSRENADRLWKEQLSLDWDAKYYDTRRSKVLNKNAR